MIRFLKKIFRLFRDNLNSFFIKRKIIYKIKKNNFKFNEFNFFDYKSKLIKFIHSNKFKQNNYLYKYAASCEKPTLYASAYAVMTLSLLDEVKDLSLTAKDEWRNYFDSFQNESDGLFYDPVVLNDFYNDSDWWGARHLALHMISAYTDLGYRPRYPFVFLEKYYDSNFIQDWLDQFDWQSASIGSEDIDNKIMNIGCLLQYQRDWWDDVKAGQAVEFIKKYLRSKINAHTGMWGYFDSENPHQKSRQVQFAYHLFQLYFYDNDYDFDSERIINLTLQTKNTLNGFGVKINSSACEDIDSIDTLIRFHNNVSFELQIKIRETLEKSFGWILTNQVNDGGFVFRLEEPFVYGSIETSSTKNEGAMLPTWFRTLSIAYLANYLNVKNNFHINNCPGYEFR